MDGKAQESGKSFAWVRTLNGDFDMERSETGKRDSLTGVLKKNIAEAQIVSALNRNRAGTLFLCDVDDLKKINDRYGHQAGDECLKETARILEYMIRSNDILGRHGGDEFLIFMPDCNDIRTASEFCRRIEKRFRMNKENSRLSYSVTAVCAVWQPGDTCRKLLGHAVEELEKRNTAPGTPAVRKKEEKDSYAKDARRVRNELIEQIRKPGAYCQDYETFKGIYRFLERGIIRSGQKACVILITVVSGQGESLLPGEKDILMERLGEDIGTTLRLGDVYTRYSSSQYLILVIDTTEGQADLIVNRIRNRFLANNRENNILVHNCYELQPARIGEPKGQDAQHGREGGAENGG